MWNYTFNLILVNLWEEWNFESIGLERAKNAKIQLNKPEYFFEAKQTFKKF